MREKSRKEERIWVGWNERTEDLRPERLDLNVGGFENLGDVLGSDRGLVIVQDERGEGHGDLVSFFTTQSESHFCFWKHQMNVIGGERQTTGEDNDDEMTRIKGMSRGGTCEDRMTVIEMRDEQDTRRDRSEEQTEDRRTDGGWGRMRRN